MQTIIIWLYPVPDLQLGRCISQAIVSKATAPLQKVAAVLEQRLPQLTSMHSTKLYLQCVYGDCDPNSIVKPEMKVCFTDIGCSNSEKPPGAP